MGYVLRLEFNSPHLHQNTSNNDTKGLVDPLQCNYNVPKKKILSKKEPLLNTKNNLKRNLKKYGLLNNKHLSKRKNIYYFVFYFENNTNKQFSLRTTDFLISNIIKYKILIRIEEELKKMNLEDLINQKTRRDLGVFRTKNGFNITIDDEKDEKLVDNIENQTVRSIKKYKIDNVVTNIDLKTKRKSRRTIKKYVDLFIKDFRSRNKNQKTVENYIPKYNLLLEYFNYKKIYSLKDITKKDCLDLQTYLINYPKNITKYKELKDKNIFDLINRSDKILDKYETFTYSTVDNYITRYKTLFNYFVKYDYVNNNHFLLIENLKKKVENPLTHFQKKEDIRQQLELEDIELL